MVCRKVYSIYIQVKSYKNNFIAFSKSKSRNKKFEYNFEVLKKD